MKIIYTRHAIDKLKRKDIKAFGINKIILRKALTNQTHTEQTRYNAWATLLPLNGYTLRVIYVKLTPEEIKLITFHITKKGRYERKVLPRR